MNYMNKYICRACEEEFTKCECKDKISRFIRAVFKNAIKQSKRQKSYIQKF